jgi:HK97 family phage prohead protease
MSLSHPPDTAEIRRALDAEVERRFGRFGGVERRGATPVSLIDTELRAMPSGDPERSGQIAVRGYASVFNRWSLELASPKGTFREKIVTGAFDRALAKDPNVVLLWDHDPSLILGSTRAADPESLELRVDLTGLHFFSRVVNTSYAQDLRELMAAGIINQASFGFTVADDTWTEKNGEVLRSINEVDELFDVTITRVGAYPATASQLIRQRAFDYFEQLGRPEGEATGGVAHDEGTVDSTPSRAAGESSQEERTPVDLDEARARLEFIRTEIRRRKLA